MRCGKGSTKLLLEEGCASRAPRMLSSFCGSTGSPRLPSSWVPSLCVLHLDPLRLPGSSFLRTGGLGIPSSHAPYCPLVRVPGDSTRAKVECGACTPSRVHPVCKKISQRCLLLCNKLPHNLAAQTYYRFGGLGVQVVHGISACVCLSCGFR